MSGELQKSPQRSYRNHLIDVGLTGALFVLLETMLLVAANSLKNLSAREKLNARSKFPAWQDIHDRTFRGGGLAGVSDRGRGSNFAGPNQSQALFLGARAAQHSQPVVIGK